MIFFSFFFLLHSALPPSNCYLIFLFFSMWEIINCIFFYLLRFLLSIISFLRIRTMLPCINFHTWSRDGYSYSLINNSILIHIVIFRAHIVFFHYPPLVFYPHCHYCLFKKRSLYLACFFFLCAFLCFYSFHLIRIIAISLFLALRHFS